MRLGLVRACPAKAGAEEFVFPFTLQSKAAGFHVEAVKFCGITHSFGKSFSQDGPLATGNPDAMQLGDSVPANISLGIE